jgi:hypothetical protein
MGPPSKLAIATSSLQRLIKEEASYHKEATRQEARITKIEAEEGDENKEYVLKQEVRDFNTCTACMKTNYIVSELFYQRRRRFSQA